MNRIEEEVSKIIVESCKIDTLFNKTANDFWYNREYFDPSDCTNRFHCGSSAEFYIEPLISDIGDFDYMGNRNDQLAAFEMDSKMCLTVKLISAKS